MWENSPTMRGPSRYRLPPTGAVAELMARDRETEASPSAAGAASWRPRSLSRRRRRSRAP
jgi:hypothetical protein